MKYQQVHESNQLYNFMGKIFFLSLLLRGKLIVVIYDALTQVRGAGYDTTQYMDVENL